MAAQAKRQIQHGSRVFPIGIVAKSQVGEPCITIVLWLQAVTRMVLYKKQRLVPFGEYIPLSGMH